MSASHDRLRRLEALARDPAASEAERATAERLAARERAALGPAASSSSAEKPAPAAPFVMPRWGNIPAATVEELDVLRERVERLRGLVAARRPLVAAVRREAFRPAGQWAPGRRW